MASWIYIYDETLSSPTAARPDVLGHWDIETGLLPGSYYAAAINRAGYIDEVFDNIPCSLGCSIASGTPLSLSTGTEISGVDFLLAKGGSIRGTVSDIYTGNPLVASIKLFDSTGGLLSIFSPTDTFGRYAITGLSAGTYYARTENSTGYIDELYADMPCPNGACTATEGTALIAMLGTDTPGIDFGLAPPCPFPTDLDLTGLGTATKETYQASSSITAIDFQVRLPAGDALFRAGDRIALGDGFSIEDGCGFRAQLDTPVCPSTDCSLEVPVPGLQDACSLSALRA